MKKLATFLVLALTLLAPSACGKPTQVDDVPPEGCDNSYLELEGLYGGDLIVEQDGEVVLDVPTKIRVFQSAGAGTSWGGVTGTAKSEYIEVDFAITTAHNYKESLQGTAYPTSAVFDGAFTSPQGTTELHYEFTNLEPVQTPHQAASIPEFTFDTWREVYGLE